MEFDPIFIDTTQIIPRENMIKKIALFGLLTLTFLYSSAQFNVSNTAPFNSPTSLVNNVLLGDGVVATNINFYGDSTLQIGYFTGMNSIVGLDSGIVLTTGDIDEVPLNGTGSNIPNTANSGGFGPSWFGTTTNNNLLSVSASVPNLLGQTFNPATDINDAAVLSFDFVPSSDTVEFRYTFASLEWNTYPCTQYNDVFGFFCFRPWN